MATYKDNVRVATTGNITLSGTQTIDGVALAVTTPRQRVLVKDQTTAKQNGIYTVGNADWRRASDADTDEEMGPETTVRVSEGALNAHTEWSLTTAAPIKLDTTALTFARQYSGALLSTPSLRGLRAIKAPARELVFVKAYETEGDQGGGTFGRESSTPTSAIITDCATNSKSVTGATQAMPIVLTVTAHGLQTGHTITVSGVGGLTSANGTWAVRKVSDDSIALLGSDGRQSAPYTSEGSEGTCVWSLVTTQDSHGLMPYDRVLIAGVTGATQLNGHKYPIGTDLLAKGANPTTTFTVPITTSAYGTGGILGDGGVFVPNDAGTFRWRRLFERDLHVAWFGAVSVPTGGTTDSAAAIQGALNAAGRLRTGVRFGGGLYRTSRELHVVQTCGPISGTGATFGQPNAGGTTIQPLNKVRAVLTCQAQQLLIEGLTLYGDAINRYATFGLLLKGGANSRFVDCMARDIAEDGVFFERFDDWTNGGAAYNDWVQFKNWIVTDCGKVFCTSGVASEYSISATQTVDGTLAVPANVGGPTVTLSGTATTKFTTMNIRKGDFLRLGAAPNESYLEIDHVVDDTHLVATQAEQLVTSYSGESSWAIAVGDGLRTAPLAPDSGRMSWDGGTIQRIAGCGVKLNNGYGPVFSNMQVVYTGMYGIGVGCQDGGAVHAAVFDGVYFEGSSGLAGNFLLNSAAGVTIDQAVLAHANVARQIVLSFNAYQVTGVVILNGDREEIRGLRQEHVDVSTAMWRRSNRYTYPESGYQTFPLAIHANSVTGAQLAAQLEFPLTPHVGTVALNLTALYKTNGPTNVQKGVWGFIPYTWNGTTLTVGMWTDTTPLALQDAYLPTPILSSFLASNGTCYLRVSLGPVGAGSNALSAQLTVWGGMGELYRAAIYP